MQFSEPPIRLRPVVAVLAIAAFLLPANRSFASIELQKALRDLAREIKEILKKEGVDAVAIGSFTGPASFPTASGPAIAKALEEELTKQGFTVKLRAKFGIKGSYQLVEQPATNKDDANIGKKVLAIKFKASLEDATTGDELAQFSFDRILRGEATLLELVPVSVTLPPNGTELERDKQIRDAIAGTKKDAEVGKAIQGTVIRSDAGKPYGLEIIVNGKPRSAEIKDGLVFVPIERNETYAVRLINDSDLEAAVQLRIDGLSMFAFSEVRNPTGPKKGEPRYSVVILSPKSSAVIRGWHVTNTKTDEFLVTEYAKSGAASLKQTANIGTICATFQAAWEKGQPPPPDELGRKRGSQSGDATGRGQRIDQNYREVERELGAVRDSIAVRYTR